MTNVRRGPGRPPKGLMRARKLPAPGSLDRASILSHALGLCRRERLNVLSLVKVAETLNVQAATLHYHIGSREALVTGVINLFYRQLNERIDAAPPASPWRKELRRIALIWFDLKLEYSGIALYMAAEDRFRVFQNPSDGESDYGARYMDRVFRLLQSAGVSAAAAAECWHQLALLTTASASDIAARHSPSEHAAFLLDQTRRHAGTYDGLAFALPELARLDPKAVFTAMADAIIASVRPTRHRKE